MHITNVVLAWITSVQDQLRDERRGLGLTSRDLSALTLVATHDGCSMDWLKERVDLTQSGTVRLVDRLAAQDLLVRLPRTGRGVALRVTPAGTRALRRWAAGRDRVVTAALGAMPPETSDALVRAMAVALQEQSRTRHQADVTCRGCTWSACEPGCPVDRSVPVASP